MKKLVLGLATLLCASAVSAQSNKTLSAYNYMKRGDFIKAKAAIDAAAVHPKTINDAKTFFYRGKIYYALATQPGDQYKEFKNGTALVEAAKAFEKAKTLPGKKKFNLKDLDKSYLGLSDVAFQQGVNHFNSKDYTGAVKMFEQSAGIKKHYNIVDTLAFFNSALAAERGKDLDVAIKYYQKCIDLEYKGGRTYYDVAKLQQEKGDVDGALATLNEGLKKYPEDQTLLTSSINIYLKEDRVDEALANLNSAIENDPNNSSFYFARGTLFDKKGDMENAEKDYKTSIDLNKEGFDANYNLGALYVNESGKVQNEMNGLAISEQKKYDELKTKRDDLFRKAIPFLERALEIQPNDRNVQSTLMELYGKTGQNDKYTEMKTKLTGGK